MEEEIKDRAEVTSQDENTVQNGEKYASANNALHTTNVFYKIKQIFSIDGRIRRREYNMTLWGAIICLWLSLFWYDQNNYNHNETLNMFVCIFIAIWGYILFAQGGKRCQDLNRQLYWQFIPSYFIWMMFSDGDDNENIFGDCPKKKELYKNTLSGKICGIGKVLIANFVVLLISFPFLFSLFSGILLTYRINKIDRYRNEFIEYTERIYDTEINIPERDSIEWSKRYMLGLRFYPMSGRSWWMFRRDYNKFDAKIYIECYRIMGKEPPMYYIEQAAGYERYY